ncbi:hypothetical protein BGZ68_005833 [Mortierella alpina]|nr:hypothetical protein BGZ68_005833 [Mortierella alpina]
MVAIPVINGVARTIHFNAPSDQEAVNGEIWYELDHPMPQPEISDSDDITALQEQDSSSKKATVSEKDAAALLNEYTAEANAQIVSHKEKSYPIHPESAESTSPTSATLETARDSQNTLDNISSTAADEHGGEKKVETTNKWNKNHDHRDLEQDDLIPQPFTEPGNEGRKDEDGIESTSKGKQGDKTRGRVLAHHHHHYNVPEHEQQQTGFRVKEGHQIANEPSLEDVTVIDRNPDLLETAEQQQEAGLSTPSNPLLSTPAHQRILAETDLQQEEPVSLLKDDISPTAPLTVPESLRTRGLVPSVFATFHIERDMAHTGWIALGIGYAMTMADLIILWPTHTPNRGAVLSRRTSHAYIEPHLVGHDHLSADALSDRPSEASLYPPDEYILHNSHPLSIDLHGNAILSAPHSSTKQKHVLTPMTLFPQDPDGSKKFIVQFTRPVKTVNRAYKLTPGIEQDFCWAYSPKPVSPDSVQDPGAHITQHQSVGSFAMDVAANQPGLKAVIQRLKAEDEQEAAAEKERRKKEIEESNRKLANEAEQRAGAGVVDEQGEGGSKAQLSEGKVAWITAGWQSSLTLQACSCLVAVAFMFFFR